MDNSLNIGLGILRALTTDIELGYSAEEAIFRLTKKIEGSLEEIKDSRTEVSGFFSDGYKYKKIMVGDKMIRGDFSAVNRG